MSKETVTDYEVMIKEKNTVNAQLERAETVVKGNIEELKDNIDILVEDFKRLKEDVQRFKHLFGAHDDHHHTKETAKQHNHTGANGSHTGNGSMFPKLAMSTVIELLINRFVLKDVSSLKKVILPILAKAFITTKVMNNDGTAKSNGTGGFLDTLKSKLSKFL
jgi:hypothetical protein